jgi:hypothetical protein
MSERTELEELVLRSAEQVDALRAVGLRGMEGVTRARQAGLEREHARLSAKLGAEHPRVQAFAQRVGTGESRLRDLRVEVTRAETVVPQAGAGEWILHGYVWLASHDPAVDLTVSLVGGRDQWIEALGFACTDERGYFELGIRADKSEADKESRVAGTAAAVAKLQAFIRITNRDRVQLCRGREPISIVPGTVEYREITLGDSRGCVSPEPGKVEPDPKGEPGPERPKKRAAPQPRRKR